MVATDTLVLAAAHDTTMQRKQWCEVQCSVLQHNAVQRILA